MTGRALTALSLCILFVAVVAPSKTDSHLGGSFYKGVN
jgi:hypothetical protein